MTARVYLKCAAGQQNAHSFLIPETAATFMRRWFRYLDEEGDYSASGGIELDRIYIVSPADETFDPPRPPTAYVLASEVAAVIDEETT